VASPVMELAINLIREEDEFIFPGNFCYLLEFICSVSEAVGIAGIVENQQSWSIRILFPFQQLGEPIGADMPFILK